MFGWFKRKPKSSPQQASQATGTNSPPVSPSTMESTKPAPTSMAKLVPAPAPVHEPSVPSAQVSSTGAAMRSILADDHNAPIPRVGMPAVKLTPAKALAMVVVVVQANGRRVLAKATGTQHVYAFTRRPDDSYQLEGASSGRGERLIVGAKLSLT